MQKKWARRSGAQILAAPPASPKAGVQTSVQCSHALLQPLPRAFAQALICTASTLVQSGRACSAHAREKGARSSRGVFQKRGWPVFEKFWAWPRGRRHFASFRKPSPATMAKAAPSKKTAKAAKSASTGAKKTRKAKRVETFNLYIHKVLKQVHPGACPLRARAALSPPPSHGQPAHTLLPYPPHCPCLPLARASCRDGHQQEGHDGHELLCQRHL